jgi:hypothetical protein
MKCGDVRYEGNDYLWTPQKVCCPSLSQPSSRYLGGGFVEQTYPVDPQHQAGSTTLQGWGAEVGICISCPNLILVSDGNLNGVSYLLQALFERAIRNSLLDPAGRKALACQSLSEFTSELHARSCDGHMSRDRLR